MKPWMQLVGIIVVGVLLVWCLGRGGLDAETKAELDRYRASAPLVEIERDSLRGVVAVALQREEAAESASARWRRQAQSSVARADRFRASADSLDQLLVGALTAEDSLPILVQACEDRKRECAELRVANAQQDSALVEADASIGNLRATIGAQGRRIALDSTRLGQADHLIGRLARAARGCRVPLIGVPCPVGVASYDLDTRGLHAGVGLPLTSWLTVSVTTRVVSRRDP
jgi:hypothetical protein